MKVPLPMLRDYVATSLDAAGVGDLLTMAGFELEGIEEIEGESVLDVKVVSNRGDGLSVQGLAREILAKDPDSRPTDLYARAARYFDDGARLPSGVRVDVRTPNCTRFAAATFTFGGGETPPEIARRLRQAGIRPISRLVDLTNYVMLEVGQPLHAFDLDKLHEGRIVVRQAEPGEEIVTLNGVRHELSPNQVVIADADRAVSIAGVMGGRDTEVDGTTRNVLLEAAHFVNTSIRATRKALNLSTEASYRFERSVDRELVLGAIRRYLELLGQPAEGMTYVSGSPSTSRVISFRADRARDLLGMEVSAEQCKTYLRRLGFGVTPGEALEVTVPSWRYDVSREEDLVEEVGRVHGYERIPERLPSGEAGIGGAHGFHAFRDAMRRAALQAGLDEVVSSSLRSSGLLDGRDWTVIGPRNPGSPELAELRNSLVPGLADAVHRNGGRDLGLFEAGVVFGGPLSQPKQEARLAIVMEGAFNPGSWEHPASASATFFTLKGVVGQILRAVGCDATYAVPADSNADHRLHPTRGADIFVGVARVGFLGQIHPEVAASARLRPETLFAEIRLAPAFESRARSLPLRAISRHPFVRRDVTFEIDGGIAYARIEGAVRAAIGSVLEELRLADVYVGAGIRPGFRSLSLSLQLRKGDGTFTDEEANQVRDLAAQALAGLGATTR